MVQGVLKICDALLERVKGFLADATGIVRSFRDPEVGKCLLQLEELLLKG